jgi:uncharacterized protein
MQERLFNQMTTPMPSDFEQAIALFNACQFFECHEILEDLWRPLPLGPEKQFLQGLLQVGVGFHHLLNNNYTGTKNLLQAGLEKLEAVNNQSDYKPVIDLPSLIFLTQKIRQQVFTLGTDKLHEFPENQLPKIQFL